MTVVEMIDQYNLERPNSVEDTVKKDYLKKCEANILESVILLYEPMVGERTAEEWEEHLDNFDYETELVVKEPFDDIYMYYLDQRIASNNNEMKRYNSSARLFDNMLLSFKQKYNRTHYPCQSRKRLFRHEVL